MRQEDVAEECKRLMPLVEGRMERLPPEFTECMKRALAGAEMMYRLQGGCPHVVRVCTTEDGEFVSPMPDDAQSVEEVRSHLCDLLWSKPGACSVEFSFTCSPDGDSEEPSSLCCIYADHQCLYEMNTAKSGRRPSSLCGKTYEQPMRQKKRRDDQDGAVGEVFKLLMGLAVTPTGVRN